MSNLINPISRSDNEPTTTTDSSGFKFNFKVSNDAKSAGVSIPFNSDDTPAAKKRGRPPKTKTLSDGTSIITGTGEEEEQSNLTMMQSNAPYLESYGETNMLLRGSIGDIDGLNGIVRSQLDSVVESKTLRKKYDYISELSSTSANLISTKIRTIAEMNKVITDSHNLDIKRMKDLKLSQSEKEGDSDKKIQDAYMGFINTPVGTYSGMMPQFPSMQDLTTSSALNSIEIAMGSSEGYDPGYNKWKQEMSPETNMMIMQKNNPNIKTVVVYDQTTNTKQFEVMDMTTQQIIPGAPKPADDLLADTYPNLNNGTARNSNIDAVYPLILTGSRSLEDY